MKKFLLVILGLSLSLCIISCGKETEEDIPMDEETVTTLNERPERVETEEEEKWVNCPSSSTKVGTVYTFTDGVKQYITESQKLGPALYIGLKYPNITAEIRVQPRTVVNPIEYDILDMKLYDNGEYLRLVKNLDDLYDYYIKTYDIDMPGEKKTGVYQLTEIKQQKTLNGEIYLALTFTDEDFSTIVCRDYNKQDIMVMNESYYGKWYDIQYRVDEGLHYNENKLDIYYTIISLKEY